MRFLARGGSLSDHRLGSITLNFFIPRLMPGNPVEAALARYQGQLTYQATKALEIAFGLNLHESLWTQYVQYWSDLLHGNLGLSFTYFPTPVSTIIAQSLPWTSYSWASRRSSPGCSEFSSAYS